MRLALTYEFEVNQQGRDGLHFLGIKTDAQMWTWMERFLVATMHDLRAGSDSPLQLIAGYNVRQLRMEPVSCTPRSTVFHHIGVGSNDDQTRECMPAFDAATMDTRPFGPAGRPYNYTAQFAGSDAQSYLRGSWFPTGGFKLPMDNISTVQEATLAVQRARQDGWLDSSTRAVFIDFAVIGPSNGFITAAKLILEFDTIGHVHPSAKIQTVLQCRVALPQIALYTPSCHVLNKTRPLYFLSGSILYR